MQTYTPTQQTAITEWRGRTDSTFTDIIEVILDYKDLKAFTQIHRTEL